MTTNITDSNATTTIVVIVVVINIITTTTTTTTYIKLPRCRAHVGLSSFWIFTSDLIANITYNAIKKFLLLTYPFFLFYSSSFSSFTLNIFLCYEQKKKNFKTKKNNFNANPGNQSTFLVIVPFLSLLSFKFLYPHCSKKKKKKERKNKKTKKKYKMSASLTTHYYQTSAKILFSSNMIFSITIISSFISSQTITQYT